MKQLYFILFLILSLILFIGAQFSSAQINELIEAEYSVLSGTAEIVNCSNASGGQMVKGLEKGSANSLLFQNINIPKAGEYYISLSYYSVSQRDFTYKINDKSAGMETIPASGDWCYQGGVPEEYIFKETFKEGENVLHFYNSPIIDKIIILTDTTARQASAIYISTNIGSDSFDGLTPETAWKTIQKINSIDLLPGDSVLFKSGETFIGQLSLLNESGNADNPILFSNYGSGELPVLDGDGYLSTIDVVNSGFIHFSNLEIKNNGGVAKSGHPENLRYGFYLQSTKTDGTIYEHFRFENLTFKNIYPTIEITDDDNTGVNAHAIITSGSWGDEVNPIRFKDMQIENCLFTRTARHATYFKAVDQLVIRNNLFEHVGGAGMVIGNNCKNILVENNVTNYTGSKIDDRMAGRGSGIWCYKCENLIVQYNKFMHARGIHDSYGMHIDIGNKNVVYQYNYSEDNEGGFVEILGANRNVGYRFNVSIGDGWRKRGNKFGQIYWFSGWSGDPKNPIGSDSIFVYNNSVYVRDSITPGIFIANVTKNSRIYNNSIHVANQFGPVVIQNNSEFNDFDYNIWSGNIPITNQDGKEYQGANAKYENPMYIDEIVINSSGFVLQAESPAIDAGKLIYDAGKVGQFDYFDNNGRIDFFGNEVSKTVQPNIGAYNGKENSVGIFSANLQKSSFTMYPNPIQNNQQLIIEIPAFVKDQNINIQISDEIGKIQIVKSFKKENRIILDLNKLAGGNYFVVFKAGDYIETKQLLIF